MKEKVVVVGGMNMDVLVSPQPHAKPEDRSKHGDFRGGYMFGTSNLGKAAFGHGGVGRNIAECLARLGLVPLVISAVGKDPIGDALLSRLESLQMSTRGIQRVDGGSTSAYVSLQNEAGDLLVAVSDMRVLNSLPLATSLDTVLADSAPEMVVIDGNLAVAQIRTVLQKVDGLKKCRVWYEPVSVPKMLRIVDANSQRIFDGIHFISPNEIELFALLRACNYPSVDAIDARNLAKVEIAKWQESGVWLLEANRSLHCIVLTLGKNGCLLVWRNCDSKNGHSTVETRFVPCKVVSESRVVNTTGAGDCFVAGFIAAMVGDRLPYAKCGEFASKVARTALLSAAAVNPNLAETIQSKL